MNPNEILQYSAVCLILLGCLVWIIVKATKKNAKNSCCGCGLKDKCTKKKDI